MSSYFLSAENAAARAKKHNSKLAKQARSSADGSAGDRSCSPSELATKPRSKGKAAATSTRQSAPVYNFHAGMPPLRLDSNWPASSQTYEAQTFDAAPAEAGSSFPLNLPSLGSYASSSHSSFGSHDQSMAGPGQQQASWNLPTPPADAHSFGGPAMSSFSPSHSSTSAAPVQSLPAYYSLPPAPSHTQVYAPSSLPHSASALAPYNPLRTSHLSPPLQPCHASTSKAESPLNPSPLSQFGDIHLPASGYADQASPFATSQTGSEAESWTSQLSSHAHSSASSAFGSAHLRQASQKSLSDACSPYLPANFLPMPSLSAHGQPHGGQQPYGGLGLEMSDVFPPHSQGAFGQGW